MDTLLQNNGSEVVILNQNPVDGSNPSNILVDPAKSNHPGHVASSVGSNSSDGDSPYGGDNLDFSDAVLKFINDVLMEEDVEGRPCMLQDCLALQAAEKSFYDVLVQKYPPLPDHFHQDIDVDNVCPYDPVICSNRADGNDSQAAANNMVESSWNYHQHGLDSPLMQSSSNYTTELSSYLPRLCGEILPSESVESNTFKLPELQKGVEDREAEKEVWKHISHGSMGRKNHPREFEDSLEETRNNKQFALITEEDSSEEHVFDEVFLVKGGNVSCPLYEASQNRANRTLQDSGQVKGDSSRKSRAKKQGNGKEMVDLWSLLSQCAQDVAIYDQRAATELLGKIRRHSSPFGDGTERLAHYFANGLEVRLKGTGAPLYTPIPSNGTLASDILKAYILYVSACPFRRISNLFANRNIAKLAEKATTVHLIDFGISYGFQWPCLIQRLSTRRGGPPKLRISGIDFPQPGFRPAERIEATGRRLRRCCENVDVPFEYNAIAKRWEFVRVEDLKIERDELIVVNCMYRLRNLPDDSVVLNSPRNIVLKLIKRINPDLFIHGVVNGSYNVPFFVTRFREAFFHFSAIFDMLEANVPREDPDRLLLEREMFGRDVMNVIAYEGLERIDRPETYKQWQFRNQKAGFRQLRLDQKLLNRARAVMKSNYHEDFAIEVDGQWILQGWKGRVIHALSCWKPVQE
ncbi:scarecrow-like protein 30 [Herrania umbratica]|uniref:Scarecrow-like protein 30 n=1 Tax=Herrania umbratica TaxID=108875 RepID=A0A6J0ZV18_9ROSI|nr:scarecrow-like protein 30 [Herrania umbratica]